MNNVQCKVMSDQRWTLFQQWCTWGDAGKQGQHLQKFAVCAHMKGSELLCKFKIHHPNNSRHGKCTIPFAPTLIKDANLENHNQDMQRSRKSMAECLISALYKILFDQEQLRKVIMLLWDFIAGGNLKDPVASVTLCCSLHQRSSNPYLQLVAPLCPPPISSNNL